ncbi:DUF2226 domain-containing protein, partial [Candidatus Pacearchaeota archaeon]|nr:DUF2226 domain-containing protein [Candidatus Pacearchaeota archaeon]
MDLPVGEEFQTNLALKDTKVTQLLQDMERSALDGCVIFTLKQEDKILDGKILFEVGKVIGASLETDNNVLEVGTRALRSVIQETNVSDGYIDIQRFTPDQIELTKEMNTESLIQDSDVWEIIDKAVLERPPVKRTTISKETGVSDIAKGFDQMGAGVGLNSSATKKGPPPLEMLEAAGPKKETVPKPQEASAMDILDAFSTKEVGPPKMEKPPLDILGPPPPRDSVVPDLTPPPTKSEFDIFGDIVPKQESKV